MGFSTKQVLGDQELDWSSGVLPSELQKPLEARMEPLKCPRCDSINTKFCYYNNYNKSQPRHFCKSCKRHWTKGGTLRNVPVGGVRKIKKVKKKIKKHQPSVNSFTENVSRNNGGFLHENEGFQFSFSSLNNFEMNMNPLLNSVPCFESFVDFKYEPKIEAAADSSAITNLMMNTSDNIIHDNQSWELPNNWNWNDLVSADLNIPRNGDDGNDHIKP